MSLYHFHRVLIGASIIFDFCFTFWTVRAWLKTGDAMQIVLAVGSSILTVALVTYLVYFNRNMAVWRHVMSGNLCSGCHGDVRAARAQGQARCPQCGRQLVNTGAALPAA